MSRVLLYGSYGFVGRLAAREALERGIDVTLAGRDREKVKNQSDELGCRAKRFDLEGPAVVSRALEDVDCVLNCAGPFSNTAEPIVDGCLQSGTDYVDITGEIPVIERIADRDDAAENAGVTLLPAAGFSAVPMDCLGAHLHDRLPEAQNLALGVDSFRVPSVGSIVTVIEGIEDGGAVVRDGDLEDVPAAWRTREVDFGRGPRPATTMPMGDVPTAHYTTDVPNVEVYAFVPQPARFALESHRYLAPVLATPPVRLTLKGLAQLFSLVREGPSERARDRGSAYLWAEARTEGERVVSRLRTPDPYEVTVDAAVTATERVLAGDAADGYQTPAGAFGPEFVFDLEGVDGFLDEPAPTAVLE